MEIPAVVNVSDIVDNSKLGLFQAGIFVLCFVCLIMDGFDMQAIGYVAPEIIREWHIPSSLLGPVFSAAPFGVLIGSLLFSMLADKIGRRPVLIGLTLYFSVMTVLTARASTFPSIEEAMRFFHTDPNAPQGILERRRFEAYLKPAKGGFAIKRDTHFRDQFRKVLATGERPKQGVDLWAAPSKLACPTLVIRGSRSDMFAAETAAKVRTANPGIKLVELDTGHHVAGGDPAGFQRETRAFIETEGL